jgi:hypothetical protein
VYQNTTNRTGYTYADYNGAWKLNDTDAASLSYLNMTTIYAGAYLTQTKTK